MATSRGKEFESFVKRDMMKVEGVDVIRLYDPVGGYSNVRNICDFIVYKKPYMFCVECKSTKQNTLNFADIRQYDDLMSQTKYDSVQSGVLIWYIEQKEIYWVDAKYMKVLREDLKCKSINIKDLRIACKSPFYYVIRIDAEIKRINPICDFKSFFEQFN